ncbi:hypothetical protein XELAEV_18020981mg [Xenopus laevis]|uniref:MARVEL domain-containing protein n=1 Tax=Xenopus laevis TaxID=8355 RepID=A0A974D8Q7_XENLA|nr:hypothetical protein XELAEV_18020981mg [Xenopus laevis]
MVGWQLNLGPLKEPLGFIKLLEWFAAIFSFATCGGYSGKTDIIVNCVENKTAAASFMYPFRLNVQTFEGIPEHFCNQTWKELHLTGDYSSPAQFYVAIGVFAFLYCMAALAFYLGLMHLYRDSPKFPLCAFGFLNLILWAGNAWFVYKETSLHSPPQQPNPEQDPGNVSP